MKGVTVALSGSTAEGEATAIRGGDGDDHITNHGELGANATSMAEAASIALTLEAGVAVAGNAVWDGGVKAEATAVGIAGDGGVRTAKTERTLTTVGGGDHVKTAFSENASGNDIIINTRDRSHRVGHRSGNHRLGDDQGRGSRRLDVHRRIIGDRHRRR